MVDSHNNLGTLFKEQGKIDAAIAEYQKAIDLDPKYALPHNNLGVIFKEQDKIDAAIAEYQKAIDLDPKFAMPHANLGDIYKRRGEPEKAISEFTRAVALDPKSWASDELKALLKTDAKATEVNGIAPDSIITKQAPRQ